MTIDHRNAQPMDQHTFRDFLGFDAGGTKIGLGLRSGLTEGWEVGLQRINGVAGGADDYHFDTKLRLAAERGWAPDLAANVGASWHVDPDQRDGWGGFGALLAGESFASRLYLSVGAIGHTNARASGEVAPTRRSAAAGLATAHLRLLHELALTGEASFPFAGRRADAQPGWAAGFKVITPRHTLALLASNSFLFGADGLALGATVRPNRAIFGFSITREFSWP